VAPRVGPVRSIRGPDFSRAGASSSGGSAISSSRSRSSPKAREPRSGWLERVVRKWLKARAAAAEDDDAEQERLRAVAMQFVGTIRGGDPDRAAEAGKWLCELLARKHGREGTDRHWREPNSLDRDDRRREPRVVSLATSRLPLGTSATALTDVFHLLRNQPRRTAMAWNFVRSAAVTALAINDADLAARDRLMRKYADPPADFPRRRWCTWRAGNP
jgi:hypothetical protein